AGTPRRWKRASPTPASCARPGWLRAFHPLMESSCMAGRTPHLDLSPVRAVSGTVVLPGSKSISNRTLLLAALASGGTEVKGLLASDDTERMLDALYKLGVPWVRHGETDDYSVQGVGGPFLIKQADLFLGNAG